MADMGSMAGQEVSWLTDVAWQRPQWSAADAANPGHRVCRDRAPVFEEAVCRPSRHARVAPSRHRHRQQRTGVKGKRQQIEEYGGSGRRKRSAMPRTAPQRGGKSAKPGLSAEQVPVLVARDRQGATTDAVLAKLNRVSIAVALGDVITPVNAFCCGCGTAIVAFARRAGIATHILPMPCKPNPMALDFHLNNVNAYHSRLQEQRRRCHGVATENLPDYLGWRRALEALGNNAAPATIILGASGLGPYQQTPLPASF